MRYSTLGEMLTEAEILLAVKLNDRQKIRDQIIKPNIDRINETLGQENDPDYLAYAVAYALSARSI